MAKSRVDTLLQCTISKITKLVEKSDHLVNYEEFFNIPKTLKSKIFMALSNKGLVTDSNIDFFLSDDLKILMLSFQKSNAITDVSLIKVSKKCPNVVKLLLCKQFFITSEGLTCIADRCKYIQCLDLCGCQNVCDYGVINIIRSCKFLRSLDLGGCTFVTDRTLQSIGSEKVQLHSVSLSKTNITDEGVYSMLKGPCSKSLTEIHLNNNNDLTDDSITFIADSCPKLQVFLFHNCPKLTERSRQALQNMHSENLMNITFTVY